MSQHADPRADFEDFVRDNQYMVLATADSAGVPWATPVWFATENFSDFYWVSRPDARHSTNLAARPELCITIFDSRQAPGTGRGVYLSAVGSAVPEDALDIGLATFSRAALNAGMNAWDVTAVTGSARHRLYRAQASERFVLDDRDERILVSDA